MRFNTTIISPSVLWESAERFLTSRDRIHGDRRRPTFVFRQVAGRTLTGCCHNQPLNRKHPKTCSLVGGGEYGG